MGTLISNSRIGKEICKRNSTLVPNALNWKLGRNNMVIPYFSKVCSVSETFYIIDGSNSKFWVVSCLEIGIAELIIASRELSDNKLEDRCKLRCAICHQIQSEASHLKHLITQQIILLFKTASRSFSPEVGQVYLKLFLCCTLEWEPGDHKVSKIKSSM